MPPMVREADPDHNQRGREFTKEERMIKRSVRAMKSRARLMVQAEGGQFENRREE